MLTYPGENDFLDPDAWLQFLEAQEERLRDFQSKDY